MKLPITLTLLLLLLASIGRVPLVLAGPSPEALELIETLGLREAATPMAKNPLWKPRRVVAMLLPAMGIDSPEYEKALREAAGNVELVIDRSGNFVPSPSYLKARMQ